LSRIEALVTGSVWKIECSVGDKVAEGAVLLVLESMKMEIPVEAEGNGRVTEILREEGQSVSEVRCSWLPSHRPAGPLTAPQRDVP
jgi:acetyl-CoA carboxylase biotin carboxyl carrier protein